MTNTATTTASDTTFLEDGASTPEYGNYTTVHDGVFKDVNLYFEDSGSGRAVVLIHGWPLSGAAWKQQVAAFKDAGYRVITYDRRGFGRSDKPGGGYDYDTLAADLKALLENLDVTDATIIGFSMGGGEVARYISKYGTDRIRSIVFASAVPPYLAQGDDNPEGPLSKEQAGEMEDQLKDDRDAFFPQFVNDFYTADGELKVSRDEVEAAIALAQQSDQKAAIKTMEAFGGTDFRDDIAKIDIPTLIIHGSADGVVPFEGSGKRTHEAISGSELVVIDGAPHGANVANAQEWNSAVLKFLAE